MLTLLRLCLWGGRLEKDAREALGLSERAQGFLSLARTHGSSSTRTCWLTWRCGSNQNATFAE